jgi:two-component system sensor histidine kinase VanS
MFATFPQLVRRKLRLTVRARLTMAYSLMLAVTAATMLALIYGFMRFVPNYQIVSTSSTPSAYQVGQPNITEVPAPALSIASPIVLSSANDILSTLLITSLLVLVALGAAGIGTGWIMAGRLLKPLQQINNAAREAGKGALDHRIRLDGPKDEITDLAETFDEMLDRLERSFSAHRRFAANASHELRTPLAASRTMIDVALAHPGRHELPQLLERLQAVNRHSSEIVESLLYLHAITQLPPTREPQDLAAVAKDTIEKVRTEATTLALSLSIEAASAPVQGDPVLLRQLVMNLVQNAIRYNIREGQVVVRTGTSNGKSFVEVINTGAIIPPDIVDLLVEPFYRTSSRIEPGLVRGHGLGLALVQKISEAHGGQLVIMPNQAGGLTVKAQLDFYPRANADQPATMTPAPKARTTPSRQV